MNQQVVQRDVMVEKLSKDLRDASKIMSHSEARFLVDLYYQIQKFRVSTNNTVKAISRLETGEPSDLLQFFLGQEEFLEAMIKDSLDRYSKHSMRGKYIRSIYGIGPVISAAFLAHIDMSKSMTAGGLLKFSGQDPSVKWNKGEKKPWNGRLKTICFHAGSSFIKFRARPKDMYGRLFEPRRNYEIAKNEQGLFADQAKYKLENFNIGKDTIAYRWYAQGKLPPAHINSRVRRWIVRHFLSHLHDVWFFIENGEVCKYPYMSIMDNQHVHFALPPVLDGVPGMSEAMLNRENFTLEGKLKPVELIPMLWEDYVQHCFAMWGADNRYPEYAKEEIEDSDPIV